MYYQRIWLFPILNFWSLFLICKCIIEEYGFFPYLILGIYFEIADVLLNNLAFSNTEFQAGPGKNQSPKKAQKNTPYLISIFYTLLFYFFFSNFFLLFTPLRALKILVPFKGNNYLVQKKHIQIPLFLVRCQKPYQLDARMSHACDAPVSAAARVGKQKPCCFDRGHFYMLY